MRGSAVRQQKIAHRMDAVQQRFIPVTGKARHQAQIDENIWSQGPGATGCPVISSIDAHNILCMHSLFRGVLM